MVITIVNVLNEGDMEVPWTPQHSKKKKGKHCITTTEFDETPLLQYSQVTYQWKQLEIGSWTVLMFN